MEKPGRQIDKCCASCALDCGQRFSSTVLYFWKDSTVDLGFDQTDSDSDSDWKTKFRQTDAAVFRSSFSGRSGTRRSKHSQIIGHLAIVQIGTANNPRFGVKIGAFCHEIHCCRYQGGWRAASKDDPGWSPRSMGLMLAARVQA